MHELYVEQGYCPFIDESKTWCNGRAGHSGNHWAVRILHDGSKDRVVLRSAE